MPKPKWSTFADSKEYLIWTNIEQVCREYDLSGDNFVTRKDIGGVYWEPLLDRILKLGVTIKCVPKSIKYIKMNWIRPLLYLESQSSEKVTFDGESYLVNKGAIGLATTLRFAMKRLLDSMVIASTLNEENFAAETKTMKENVKYFFKCLAAYVKEGYRAMHENIKEILKPLRMLRKSGYRLFSLEKTEENNVDLTMLKDKKSLEIFKGNIKDMFKWDEFKTKKDSDIEMLREFLDKNTKQELLSYHFTDEKREESEIKENPYESIAKKDINENKDNKDIKDNKEKLTPEEKMLLKQAKELHKLIYPNIDNLSQKEPTRFLYDALQAEFENGINAMIEHLNKKLSEKFPYNINAKKMFLNIKAMNAFSEIATDFYIKQLEKEIYQMKVKCYEMKLNGLSRVLIPITENKEIIEIIKNVYDLHILINETMGNILKREQYLFFYQETKRLTESNLKEELEIIKDKHFIENGVYKYLIFQAMCASVISMEKMIDFSKKNKKKFAYEDFWQLTSLDINDIESSNDTHYYSFDILLSKKLKPHIKLEDEVEMYLKEVKLYDRFFLLEDFIPCSLKDKYILLIDNLRNINTLIREDIKDYLLTSSLPKKETDNDNLISSKNSSKTNSRVSSPRSRIKSGSKHQKKSSKAIRNPNRKKTSDSIKSEESIEKNKIINAKLDLLRPPNVWNYPVERVEEMQNKIKNENKKKYQNINQPKNEIRNVDPRNSYIDGRVVKFLNMFEELVDEMLLFSKHERNDSFEYLVDKVFIALGIKYLPFKKFETQVHMPFDVLKAQIQSMDSNTNNNGNIIDNNNANII